MAFSEFRCAYRREILGVGEENCPWQLLILSQPLVELEITLSCLQIEVRNGGANP